MKYFECVFLNTEDTYLNRFACLLLDFYFIKDLVIPGRLHQESKDAVKLN